MKTKDWIALFFALVALFCLIVIGVKVAGGFYNFLIFAFINTNIGWGLLAAFSLIAGLYAWGYGEEDR